MAAEILRAGLAAVDPAPLVAAQIRRRGRTLRVGEARHTLGRGRVLLLAVGKAARPMAAAAEHILGDAIAAGLVVSSSPGSALGRSRCLVAGHPLPDARGVRAAREVEGLLQGTTRHDLLLVLLSGGASALLPAPAAGISLHDKARTTALLLHAGATVQELNTVRKHLSRFKGGGLASLAAPARVVTLALSDVIGDDPALIGSGPTYPDPTTFRDAWDALEARGVVGRIPRAVRRHLARGVAGEIPDTPKPGGPLIRRATTTVIGSGRTALAAAEAKARELGFRPLVLTSRLEGEAREVARALVAVLRECVEFGVPAAPPVALLAAGETTVTVRGSGHGGRNQELAAASAAALDGFPVPALVASCASDGVDGRSPAAGGVADDRSAARARGLGLAPIAAFLGRNDSHSLLATLGDLIVTGPTHTNVADLVVLAAEQTAAR